MKRFYSLAISALLAVSAAWGVDYTPKYELINNPEFPTLDVAVATFNVKDYGIDATGKTDCTAKVQALLDAAAGVGTLNSINGDSKQRGWYGNTTGGIVYFPAGTYLFTSSIVIPRGVTIRGDWQEPDGNSPIKGTIFKVNPTRGAGTEIEGSSFIVMQPSTMVYGIAFWYPEQKPSAVKKYPPTVLMGQTGYFGNDYCNVEHCTFINSYTAVQFNTRNGGGCPNIFDIYGTPLGKGIQIDCLADVGRFDGLHFAPSYWENSGMEDSPAKGEIDSWLYENAIGVVMRRNDWSYTCNLDVDGYRYGFVSQPSGQGVALSGNPNGHNYNFNLKNCHTGVRIEAASNSGLMFTRVNTTNCAIGLDMPEACIGPVQLYGCNFSGTEYAVLLEDKASPGAMMQACNVDGRVDVLGGQFSSISNSYNKNVYVAPPSRVIFAGNKMSGSARLVNESLFECVVDDSPVTLRALPEYSEESLGRHVTRPAREALYVVTDAEFGAQPLSLFDDLANAKDNTSAIQKALDKAGNEGGGVVYLPSGHYRVNGTLTIPAGVELKGSSDIQSVPRSQGAILEAYSGRGNENGTPFITMGKGSGLRGVTINYPEQTTPINPAKYPYSVRGNADCYIVNLALRTAYRGVDLFTNKCDNHYVDYISGHAYMNVVRVGNGSKNGTISNIQCNTIAYGCGDETKYGCWPNSMVMTDNLMSKKAYGQNSEDLDFMIIGDCTDELLYNNFLFGCHQGIVFRNDGNGGPKNVKSLGNAVDGAVETFVFESGDDDIDLVNSQIVALNHDKEEEYINQKRLSAVFVKSGEEFKRTATFFSGNFWGGGDRLVDAKGGTLNFYSANFANSGSVATLSCSDNAKVNFVNVDRRTGNKLIETSGNMEKNCTVYASIINCNGALQHLFSQWKDNLAISWTLLPNDNLTPRTGWTATAFNDATGYGSARNAIDGNDSSRWSSDATQHTGQWFAVDFGKTETINTVILDTSGSPNDGPKGYTLEVRDDSGNWRQVAEGTNGSSCLVINFDEVSCTAVRIRQTTDQTAGFWSIHEFYVADIKLAGVESANDSDEPQIAYCNGALHFPAEYIGEASFELIDMSGRRVVASSVVSDRYALDGLVSGVYIAVVRKSDGKSQIIKFVKH